MTNLTYSYIPLLEGKSGKVYIQNPTSGGFYYAGVPGGLGAFNSEGFLRSGALSITTNSSSSYQGRLKIAANLGNPNDKKFELQYNGAAWDKTTADNFPINITARDTAYSDGTSFDLYQFSPGPKQGELDVYYSRRGGSDYDVYVWALSVPTPVTFTPSSIPADGQPHIITISLGTRLHSSQNPTMQLSLVGTGAPSVTLGAAIPIRNTYGQITGYSISATANGQPSATGSWRLTAFENLTYLKNDVIVTENVPYYTNQVLSATLGVSSVSVSEPLKVVGASLRAGSGADLYWGKMETGVAVPRFAGGIVAELKLTSGTPFGTERVVVTFLQAHYGGSAWDEWPTGLSGHPTTGVAVDGTTLSQGGSILYSRTISFHLNPSLIGSLLYTWPQIDFGYTAIQGSSTVSGLFNSSPLANGNIDGTPTNGGWDVQIWSGTTVPGEWLSGFWSPSQPTFAGVVTIYLSEHWNAYDTGATNLTPYFDTIEYSIDGGAWVSLDPSSFSTAMLASTFSGGGSSGGGGGGCVPAGTILLTTDGQVLIEDATIGQSVLAFDEVTLTNVEATVSNVLAYKDRELYNIETQDGSLVCSHDHRLTLKSSTGSIFYVPARDLIAGDNIVTYDGTKIKVSPILSVESTGKTATVHHITLSGGHVFVAGGFLAHNMKSQAPIL